MSTHGTKSWYVIQFHMIDAENMQEVHFRCKSTHTLKYVLYTFSMRNGKGYTCAICDLTTKNKLDLDLTLEEAGITDDDKIYVI